MEWVFQSSQIHSIFSNLGFLYADGYHVNENCNGALETILRNILTEDENLRTFRRSISFGQNIKKDLIPLLIHAKEDKTIELLVGILVNLTIPIECLLSVEAISKNDFGRHTIFELNNLLSSTKTAFSDHRATRVIIEFLKKNVDFEQKSKLSPEQCTNICNGLLLLRNILHIPEETNTQNAAVGYNGTTFAVQNQILWNIFSQSFDKVLIKLMTIPDANKWAVTMVQLIALLYKDQHVVTLHKLLNLWLETSLSESSEDNESNTTPPDRGSDDSSPMLTSDPTSDSSDNCGSGKSNDDPNSLNNGWNPSSVMTTSENCNQPFQPPKVPDVRKKKDVIGYKPDNEKSTTCSSRSPSEQQGTSTKVNTKIGISETSDCGYGTQIENQESISTSSNEDDIPARKPVYQKPHNPKQRINNKCRSGATLQERKRKKIVRRGKSNIINVQGLSHKTPTDDDISNILKEFTVDFLLKGYNALVQTLHNQILINMKLEIDTSHFFWLITYFLKFATQIELDLEHVGSVLSFDIASYLTAEGVNLCEQFELALKINENNLKPCMRRLHLVVTAIREFIQAIDMYKRFSHSREEDHEQLVKLQIKICESEEMRSLMVLLLRHYNPNCQTKQYLQDLIVTNHIFLTFLDNVKLPDYCGFTNMVDHIRQFATPEVMHQYGILLEDYTSNGEFVNDCIFTVMHHVAGELDSLISLYQPKILKAFTSIWKSEFEICDDWSDLIEYVINTFIKKPQSLHDIGNLRLKTECFEDDKLFVKPDAIPLAQPKSEDNEMICSKLSTKTIIGDISEEKWTEGEISTLSWNYMQCNSSFDVIEQIIKLFKENAVTKTRDSVITELYKQNIINIEEFEKFVKGESERSSMYKPLNKESRNEEIEKICEQLKQDGNGNLLGWVQKVLLETCLAKICLKKKSIATSDESAPDDTECKLLNFELFKKKSDDFPVISPVSYHSFLFNQSVPLVPWNCKQASICKDLKFLQLLHKLGFHMPVDSGKVFIRIPHFWTTDLLYDVAGKIAPIDKTTLKFSLNDIVENEMPTIPLEARDNLLESEVFCNDITMTDTPDKLYKINKDKHPAPMVNFTPMPTSALNFGSGDAEKHNWLQVVQKSQELKKICLNTESPLTGVYEGDKSDIVMQPAMKTIIPPTVTLLAGAQIVTSTTASGVAALLMPTVMTTKQEISHYTVNLAETEYCNNSVCDTASVASDLTRMYVSDEDEKSEIRPIMVVSPVLDDQSCDSDNISLVKRPRLNFTPKFESITTD